MYELAPDVFACTTGRNCIFLDLRRNRYLGVSASRMRFLAPLICGWQLDSNIPDDRIDGCGVAEQLTEELFAAGILCEAHSPAHAAGPLPPAATRELAIETRTQVLPIPLADRIEIFYTLANADIALHRTTLLRIVARFRAAAVRQRPDLYDPPPWEVESVTCKFLAVRPWYPRNCVCLYDSLALMLYLGRRGIRGNWIFAVREDPFAAHCWVQYRGTVLNDHLDRSRLYKPIMAI